MTPHAHTIDDAAWKALGTILLVGHRGAGKSTLGKAVADRLGRPYFDLDIELERRTNTTPAQLLSRSRSEFRRRETQVLSELCNHQPAPIIACGGGTTVDPCQGLVVWLDREDWRGEVAHSDRPRVRPQMSEIEEWDWMEKTRPPQWLDISHLRLKIPRGRPAKRSARDLATYLRWAAVARRNKITARTWLVPAVCDDLERAITDACRFGMAGVELRSDVFAADSVPPQSSFVASLRHDDQSWLTNFGNADAWDVDLRFASSVAQNEINTRPSRLIVSHHPERPKLAHLDELTDAADNLAESMGLAEDAVEIKYVPQVSTLDEFDILWDLTPRLRALREASTILAGGRRFAWSRPIFAAQNANNYLPVGLRGRSPDHPSALDFSEFLPHLAGPAPTVFDALLGSPVSASQGDLWHRRAGLETSTGAPGYLKIETGRGELDRTLRTLVELPIRGLSVTSPLKVEAAKSGLVDNFDALPAINTLRRHATGDAPWRGVDTDTEGMDASLYWLEERGVGPGRVVVFGRGGASHAVLRSLEGRGWTVAAHISARQGWLEKYRALSDIDLIVNAAGPQASQDENTPESRAWLDLHYTQVAPSPPDSIHLIGDLFFDAQARAQREFWSSGS